MNSFRITDHRTSQLTQNLQRGILKSQRREVIWPRSYTKIVAEPRQETKSPNSQGQAPAETFSDRYAENQIMAKLSFSKLTAEEFYSLGGSLSGKQEQKIPNLLYLLSHIKFYYTSKYSLQ